MPMFRVRCDSTRPVTLRGTVAEVLWNNPHTVTGTNLTLPDGRRLFTGSSGTGAPEK